MRHEPRDAHQHSRGSCKQPQRRFCRYFLCHFELVEKSPLPLSHSGRRAAESATAGTATGTAGASAAGTAHLRTVEASEPPCKRQDDVTAEGVVVHLGVVVVAVCYAQVLGLSEYVVTLEGDGHGILEEELLDFSVQDVLGPVIELA